MGKGVPLKEIFNPEHKRYGEGGEFRALHDQDPDVRTIYKTALGLEGQIRNWGVHAAGVIMSSEPLIDIVPIMARPQDGAVITQFDYPMCESLGLVKMDFLGLSNLHILDDAVANIEANRGENVVLEELPFDDRATYELMGRGDTLGVFQLDGGGMRGAAALDAARPVRRHHRGQRALPSGPDGRGLAQQVRPPQERPRADRADPPRARRGARAGAGGDLRPDRLPGAGHGDRPGRWPASPWAPPTTCAARWARRRRRSSTSSTPASRPACSSAATPRTAIDTLWEILLPFSDYAFNKSHSAAYGVITYWTAYLKANYPAEYMAALLTSVKDDKDKMAIYLNECRRMKIQVLPPDVNESAHNFTPVGRDIRFGLTAIRNVGANVVDGIVEGAHREGPVTRTSTTSSRRCPAQVCNKRVIESLIKAGAFDDMKHRRRALVAIHEAAVDQYVDIKRNEAIGQDSLFGGLDDDGSAASASRCRSPTSTSGTR